MLKKTLVLSLVAALPLSAMAATTTTTTTTQTTVTKKVVHHTKKVHHAQKKHTTSVVAAPVMNDKTIAPVMVAKNAAFVGANVAAGIGYNMLNFNNRDYTAVGHDHHDVGNNGFATQLSGGYNWALGSSWILGPEVHVQYNTTTAANSGNNDFDSHTSKTTVHWIYGAAAKFGYATSADNLLFGLVGADFGYYHHDFHNAFTSESNHATKPGLLLGVGAEQALTACWHIREQFNYDLFATNKVTLANGDVSKTQAQSGTFLVSAVYNF